MEYLVKMELDGTEENIWQVQFWTWTISSISYKLMVYPATTHPHLQFVAFTFGKPEPEMSLCLTLLSLSKSQGFSLGLLISFSSAQVPLRVKVHMSISAD